jgi:GH43 family beta-xylosidase
VPTVGTRQFNGVSSSSGPNSWTEATEVWTPSSPSGHVDQATVSFTINCNGDFNHMVLAIDDVTFTEIKCEPLST